MQKVKLRRTQIVVIATLVIMAAAGYSVLTEDNRVSQEVTLKVASFVTTELPREEKTFHIASISKPEEEIQEEKDFASERGFTHEVTITNHEEKVQAVNKVKPVKSEDIVSEPFIKEDDAPAVIKSPMDQKTESKSVGLATETPIVQPVVSEEPAVYIEETKLSGSPVSFNWGNSAYFLLRMEVKVKNNGSETAKDVIVSVPLLENTSPYQITKLKSTSYNIVGSSGRFSTFNLGEVAPGETKTIVADFDITVRSFSISSSNLTLDKARTIYEQHAGYGYCREKALAFISKCREQGITAREVIGFARPQRGPMTSGYCKAAATVGQRSVLMGSVGFQ